MDKRLRYISLLRCFDAAARCQSYSLAARELSITQAAVSQQIRALEQNLNIKLFLRSGRSMVLSKQGKILADYVGKSLALISQGFDHVQVEPESGTLTVTTTLSFASIWLVPRLWKFAEQHPDIIVKVVISSELEDLRHSEIDIAIRQGESKTSGLFQEELFVDPVFPICSAQLVTQKKLQSIEQISSCQLIEIENPGNYSWENWFRHANAPYQAEQLSWIEVSSWEMGLNAVMTGNSICLAPSIMANYLIEKGLLAIPFDIPIEPGVPFSFLYDQGSPRLARISRFHSWLKMELK